MIDVIVISVTHSVGTLLEHNMKLGTLLLAHPNKLLPIFDEGESFRKIQQFPFVFFFVFFLFFVPHKNSIVMHAAAYQVQVQWKSETNSNSDSLFDGSVKRHVHVRLMDLPMCSEIHKSTVSAIRSSDINRVITVAGTCVDWERLHPVEFRNIDVCFRSSPVQ